MSKSKRLDGGKPQPDSHEKSPRDTIDAYFPIDLETGLLNRNGLIDSIHRSTLWWKRRREHFAVLAVYLPGVEEVAPAHRPPLIRHLAATVAATMREVDETGRVDDATYVVVLRDFHSGGITSITDRIRNSIGAAADQPGFNPAPRLGFCLVGSDDLIPSAYLDAAIDAAHRAAFEPVVIKGSDG